ncbi:hypothetical protein TSOC_012546 [Tetrabaena socialis]|uniref:Uncharacterized protein n=1 Tax=Tetrabaena socialis TaxID=47790 RepID=A0A2J7ZMR4_9CHLO|nr:hypothetical protein TSOC_012546 [Tetrabaena socialis]|eukprot:PNH01565.1 hypothetical protein TSOC_012546 [Tetrabaena socialis]
MILASIVSTAALTLTNYSLPFIMLWFSAVVHMPFSVGYHLFLPISPATYNRWRKLDLAFIFVASAFLTFALDYFVLPWWGTLVNTAIAVVISALAIVQISRLQIGQTLQRATHCAFLGSIIIVYLFPMCYRAIEDVRIYRQVTVPVWSTLGAFLSLLVGAVLYVYVIPNACIPEAFDMLQASD